MANGTPDTSGRRVLRILQYLARHQRPVLASAVARDCGLPRSSTYRLLHVMAEERFVTYYPDDGRWGLGLAAYELGTGYLLGDPLSRQAAGILARLAAETGAFMAIGVLDGTDVVVSRTHIPEAATDWAEVLSGGRYPAHLTAMGRAILLGRDDVELAALYRDQDEGLFTEPSCSSWPPPLGLTRCLPLSMGVDAGDRGRRLPARWRDSAGRLVGDVAARTVGAPHRGRPGPASCRVGRRAITARS